METVFHDVPAGCAGATFDLAKLEGFARSKIIPDIDLVTVNITPMAMKKWGITQAELLGSDAEYYQITQQWASGIHRDNPSAHAIRWPSKQHGGMAIMVFGDRLNDNQLQVVIESELVVTSAK